MKTPAVSLEEKLSDLEKQFIEDELGTFNDAQAPAHGYRELNVVSRHGGKIVGGLLGHTHWNWLYVRILWVAKDFRGSGLGRSLMLAAEKEAIHRGCVHAHCNTFAFQALPFYQKLGYTVFGTLEDYPPGHARYFLQKRDLAGTPKRRRSAT